MDTLIKLIYLYLQEAIEKSSFFPPQRVLQRGDVTTAFQQAEHIHEGQIHSVT